MLSPSNHQNFLDDYATSHSNVSIGTWESRVSWSNIHVQSIFHHCQKLSIWVRRAGENKTQSLRLASTSRHRRSKSLSDKRRVEAAHWDCSLEASGLEGLEELSMGHPKYCAESRQKYPPPCEVQNSLKQEILLFEKRLKNQFEVRCALEKALGYRSFCSINPDDTIMPKSTSELIKEISVLELEVVHLEQHLLSLYRKAFDEQISSASPSAESEKVKSPVVTPRARLVAVSNPSTLLKNSGYSASRADDQELGALQKESEGSRIERKLLYSSVHRSQSLLSQRSKFTTQASFETESSSEVLGSCHSQPLSILEYTQNATSNIISLAEHLGARISDLVPETPNRVSEDMVKCMAAIYCKLADSSLTNIGHSPPISPVSSASAFSPHPQSRTWSPGLQHSSFEAYVDNPFLVDGVKEFSGPYSTMVEIPWIRRGSKKLGDVEDLLQNFKTLMCRLEEINPGKLKHEEKLAFWVNVYNALVMHAFLAFGIPQNNVKRLLLLIKAAYNIGGQIISASTIQINILGCRMQLPGQWLRLLLSSKTKFKHGNRIQAFAIDYPEPLLHFAICSGNHLDPAVRVYTPKRVFHDLEVARNEYIGATFGVRKDQKILLPKIVESYAKDSGLCSAGLIKMIQKSLPETFEKTTKICQLGKTRKSIAWIPHNFSFRYFISKELVG